jgi:hypothetical protein
VFLPNTFPRYQDHRAGHKALPTTLHGSSLHIVSQYNCFGREYKVLQISLICLQQCSIHKYSSRTLLVTIIHYLGKTYITRKMCICKALNLFFFINRHSSKSFNSHLQVRPNKRFWGLEPRFKYGEKFSPNLSDSTEDVRTSYNVSSLREIIQISWSRNGVLGMVTQLRAARQKERSNSRNKQGVIFLTEVSRLVLQSIRPSFGGC